MVNIVSSCYECGKDTTFDRAHYHYTKGDYELCFSCNHWIQLINTDRLNCVVINNHHYMLGTQSASTPKQYRGFSGKLFTIQYLLTGETIECVDLWHQGEISSHFTSRLPNNAIFIR